MRRLHSSLRFLTLKNFAMSFERICKYIFYIFCVLMFTCCTKIELPNMGDGSEQMITFSPQINGMTINNVTKSAAENDIYSLHLLLFDANGEIINSPFYLVNSNGTPLSFTSNIAFSIPKTNSNDAKYKNCTAYMISNISKISSSASTFFSDVTNITGLKNKNVTGSQTTYKNPSAIVCSGIKNNIDLSVSGTVPMDITRAMASININVTTSFTQTYPNTPTFNIISWEVRDIPSQTFIIPNPTNDYADLNTSTLANFTTTGTSLSFYMWENRRGGRSSLVSGKNAQPANCPDENRQCYKASYAPQKASYVLLYGVYTDHNGNTKFVTYTIYLGVDNYQDYNVRRNNRYTYNVKISSAERCDVSTYVEGYDSRVSFGGANIIIKGETELDAHYDARVMDITSGAGTINADILTSAGAATTESFWAKISFTDSPSYGANTTTEKTSLTKAVTSSSTTKIYIVVKENTDITDRTAILRVKFTAIGSSVQTQNFTIRQKGIIRIGNLGVETYEEYTKSYDPTLAYNSTVSGLQWGYYSQSNVYDLNGSALGSNGNSNTEKLVEFETSYTPFTGWSLYSLYQNYAARYCYNKNKRNANGTIIETKWFLPSLTQLNTITTSSAIPSTHPGKIDQNSVYWSSSCPTRTEVSNLNNNLSSSSLQWFMNILISVFGTNTDASNVAKASKAGTEYFNTNNNGNITVRAYPTRDTQYKVRCVRSMSN